MQASVSKSAADEDVSLTDKKEDDSKSKTSLASVPSKMEVRKYLILHSSIELLQKCITGQYEIYLPLKK